MKTLYSQQLYREEKTFFFDIRESKAGSLYLVIKESIRVKDGFSTNSIKVFEESLENFNGVMKKITIKLNEFKKQKSKTYTVSEKREKNNNAYAKWTQENDNLLERLFCERKTVDELSKIFGRNEGAIKSRIDKLELKLKYPFI
ncbi:MAG: DUF3276 family protein [Crocinitomicaceae bacterium]|nr:DUF3276 family protein [Crocinitomicaceae bacterium]MCF8445166.1 DUF3276 family protein [Crocinitomicaceae bacterium]